MGKFEYGLVGVMAFLILGVLGMIAVSPDAATIEPKEPGVMEEPEHRAMETTHTHEVMIPVGSAVIGCEETNECYIPYSISIKTGHAVTWINEDSAAHTVTSGTASGGSDGTFDSGLLPSGATFEYTFDESASYDYYCIVHPWMTGIIKAV